ncbi:MAG: corrinoid protein, partial [Anaerolineae bacterium]|nr:corrinoid protein [Anaerolineae bacterium]
VSAVVILNDGMISAMSEVGRLFEEGEYFVPEMLIAARAMDKGMQILKPHLVAQGIASAGKVAIGTVKGDLHDIGKKLVAMMLEGGGFEIIDLGIDVPPDKFVDAVRNGAQVVALSALLTTTMPNMKSIVDALRDAGLRDQVRVIIGGAPVSESYAMQIGADGYATDASSAVRKVRQLLSA